MHLNFRILAGLVFCFAVAVCLLPSVARAHAVLLESNPPLNGQVAGPNIPVRLRFDVRIDATRSRITLVAPDGSTQALPLDKETTAETLTSQANGLKSGQYKLRWQVLASDGHLTRGEILFTVV